MSLRLVIEHSPHPQPQPERQLLGGDLSIGRAADCDWQIDDPEMYVSRRHCVVSLRDGRCSVTDASRGGLFIDGADRPLGAGTSAPLQHGSRLRLGDVVIRVELTEAPRAEATSQPQAGGDFFGKDDFFSRPAPTPEPPPPRPETLPQPFGSRTATETAQAAPPKLDTEFALARSAGGATTDFGFGSFFSGAAMPPDPPPVPDPPPAPEPQPEPERMRERAARPPKPPSATPPATPSDAAAQDAFLRGLGLADTTLTEAEMEALGRRFRLLAEGLVQLLRSRAAEKGSARVAQTVIGNADVNPLKFLATGDEILAALIAPRGPGYLEPDAAIAAAFHDLTDHQRRTWIGVQSALRRMIDRFDPATFETEANEAGLLKAILSGGRSARLWQLYEARYREIARAAEDRFLGEIGADFREAYEGNPDRRTKHD